MFTLLTYLSIFSLVSLSLWWILSKTLSQGYQGPSREEIIAMEDNEEKRRLAEIWNKQGHIGPTVPAPGKIAQFGVPASFVIMICLMFILQVPIGHVKVGALFGKVQDEYYTEGLHFPVNPLITWSLIDVREKTLKVEDVGIPSEDKLISKFDVSIQFRLIASDMPDAKRNIGTPSDIMNIHVIPKVRSILREQGKSVPQAQDFFKESVQQQLQASLMAGLNDYLNSKGVMVSDVLIRDVKLPQVIVTSINETKKREQEILKQQAELDRFAKEQEQKVATAQAEKDAAVLEAQKIRELADAEAYKIDLINKQLAKSPNYVELIKAEKWNGELPQYTGGDNIPMIDLRPVK